MAPTALDPQSWSGRTVVVKYGGAAMERRALADAVVQDVARLQWAGVRVVVVHGGGPAVSAWSERLGLGTRFVDGLRVTDDATMQVAQMVQVGVVARDLAAGIARCGGRAVALSGQDGGGWLRAALRIHRDRKTGAAVDLGRVGDVERVDVAVLRTLLDAGFVPLVSPVAVDAYLEPLNVNADSVAAAVAGALGADLVVFLTDVAGIAGPDGTAREVPASLLRDWIDAGVVTGGMVPKAEACLDVLDRGAGAVMVADGRVPHALLSALGLGGGTVVVHDEGALHLGAAK